MKLSRPGKKTLLQAGVLVALCAVVLACGLFTRPFSFTNAWLMREKVLAPNEFTGSNLTITFTERTGTTYELIPGIQLAKQPIVTVKAGSEACYIFVKVVESDGLADYVDYEIETSYTEVQNNYYCRDVGNVGETFSQNSTYRILKTNSSNDPYGNSMASGHITVRTEKQDGTELTNETLKGVSETLTFKVCCVQQSNLTVDEAFAVAQPILDS